MYLLFVSCVWAGGRKAQKRLRKAVRLGVEDEVDEEGSQQEEQKAKPKQKPKGKAKAKGRPKAKPKQKAKGKAKAKGHSAASASNGSESDGGGQLFETPERKEHSTTGLVPLTADEQSEDSGEKKMQAEDRLIKDEHSKKKEGRRKRRTPKKKNVQTCLDSELDAAADSCACKRGDACVICSWLRLELCCRGLDGSGEWLDTQGGKAESSCRPCKGWWQKAEDVAESGG